MKVSFEQLPSNAKVWMYQAERKLSKEELAKIIDSSEHFLAEWESHGIPVQGAIDVLHDMTIRIAAYTDEDSMCGRAQDGQMRFVKSLESLLNVQLTNRMMLAFGEMGTEQIVHMSDLTSQILSGTISRNSRFYNNLVLSKSEFESNWIMNAGNSWISTYF